MPSQETEAADRPAAGADPSATAPVPRAGQNGALLMPSRVDPAPPASGAVAAALREFHFTGVARNLTAAAAADLLPAALFPFRDPGRVRGDYPLFVGAGASCQPVGDVLQESAEASAPAQVLRDNLKRLEVCIRRVLDERPAPVDAAPVVTAAAEQLRADLDLGAEHDARLGEDLARLVAALPRGQLLAVPTFAARHLFVAAARSGLGERRREFRVRIRELIGRLQSALDVERGKSAAAHGAAQIRVELGGAGDDLLDPDRLAAVVGGHRGAVVMPEARRAVIEESLGVLSGFVAGDEPPVAVVIERTRSEDGLAETDDVECVVAEQPLDAARGHFAALAEQWTAVFRAERLGRLALRPEFDPARNLAFAAAFGWESFTADELHLLPRILAVDSGTRVAGTDLATLSRLLLSGCPVHVLLAQDPARDPASPGGGPPGGSFRLELAYLGMGHREAFVQQSTAARPRHLLSGFAQAMDTTRTALTVVDEVHPGRIRGWLQSGAAVEGRAHPLFRYDPEAGASWARRLDFSGNPEPTEDWSRQALPYGAEDGPGELELPFTFADYALLDEELAAGLAVIPDGFDGGELIPLDQYLDLPEGELAHRLPFLWAAAPGGELTRVCVSFLLARATGERLGFWRTLQDLAGVRSEHVRQAVARAQAEAEAVFASRQQQLLDEHGRELARVREAAAGEAMQGLAQMLLDTDLRSLAEVNLGPAPVATPAARPLAPPATPVGDAETGVAGPAAAAEPAGEVEEDEPSAEPWVDSVLCTSCNDCVTINARVFAYNDDKQVYLADARAGTYKEIVTAAEACPASCIHPGRPLDPSEPGVEELVERARRFD